MSFYKVVLNDKIVDVLENVVWVKENLRGRIVICGANEAVGVVSSDAKTIWHIAGASHMANHTFEDVKVVDIEESEAKELQTLLGLGGDVIDKDNGIDVEFPDETEEPEEIPEDATLNEVKRICLERLSNACQQVIFDGFTVVMTNETEKHFTLKIEDQLNLLSLSTLIASGVEAIPYHASGELCEYYSVEDMMRIITTATEFKTYHTSYFNSLKNWIESMEDITEIGSIAYGDPVPEEYRSVVLNELVHATTAVDEE